MKKLKNKVALVTGGARGIGAAIAKKLAEEGADIAINYSASVDQANALVKELERQGVRAKAFKANQADPKEVEELVRAVIKHFGHLDILVNNAGVFVQGAIDDASADVTALTRQLAVNVNGVVTAVRAAIPHMRKGSKIINIGSVVGEESPFSRHSRLQCHKSRPDRLHKRMGTRSRSKKHHCESCATRPDCHRHES